jgi:hypothetical protein
LRSSDYPEEAVLGIESPVEGAPYENVIAPCSYSRERFGIVDGGEAPLEIRCFDGIGLA